MKGEVFGVAVLAVAALVALADPLYRDVGKNLPGLTTDRAIVLLFARAVSGHLNGDGVLDMVLYLSTFECSQQQDRINTFMTDPATGLYTLREETFGGIWAPYEGVAG